MIIKYGFELREPFSNSKRPICYFWNQMIQSYRAFKALEKKRKVTRDKFRLHIGR